MTKDKSVEEIYKQQVKSISRQNVSKTHSVTFCGEAYHQQGFRTQQIVIPIPRRPLSILLANIL